MKTTRYLIALTSVALTLGACTQVAPASNMPAQPDPQVALTAQTARAAGPLQAGAPAPDFSLTSGAGNLVRLADTIQTGRTVILIFYPNGYCRLCLGVLRELEANRAAFERRGGQLIAVAPQSPAEAAASAQATGAQFAILADTQAKVARQYGVTPLMPGKPKYPVSLITVFVITTNQRIRWTGPALSGNQLAVHTLINQLPPERQAMRRLRATAAWALR
jgi:peroxiredoxin